MLCIALTVQFRSGFGTIRLQNYVVCSLCLQAFNSVFFNVAGASHPAGISTSFSSQYMQRFFSASFGTPFAEFLVATEVPSAS